MLNWKDNHIFELDGIKFTIDVTPGPNRRQSEEGNFTLVKTRAQLADYLALKDERFDNILELGIFQGGSIVLFDKLFKPKKIAGVDISTRRIKALDHYIRTDAPHIDVYYGKSQGDAKLLKSIVAKEFGGQLDLVVDDASHLYALTKTSMSVLFPLLVPGGTYLIEDWAWSHRLRAQMDGHPWANQPALTNLIFEMIIELGGGIEIDEVHINDRVVRIKKSSNAGCAAVFENKSLRGANLALI